MASCQCQSDGYPGTVISSGTGSRNRTYYDGDLRADLVAAAARSVAVSGAAGLSLRELARQLGVSHAAPKNHFRDKRALLTAVATEAHRMLLPALRSAVDAPGASDALDQLVTAARAYLAFAREHSAWFAVMWEEDLQDRDDPDLVRASFDNFAVIIELSERLIGAGRAAGDPASVATLVWSLVHGFADLSRSGALDDERELTTEAREEAFLTQMRALFARTLLPHPVVEPTRIDG